MIFVLIEKKFFLRKLCAGGAAGGAGRTPEETGRERTVRLNGR